MTDDTASPSSSQGSETLKKFIERIERLEDEKNDITTDIRQIYAEAKSSGYDVKILRAIVSLRKLEPSERIEREKMLVAYMSELGMDVTGF